MVAEKRRGEYQEYFDYLNNSGRCAQQALEAEQEEEAFLTCSWLCSLEPEHSRKSTLSTVRRVCFDGISDQDVLQAEEVEDFGVKALQPEGHSSSTADSWEFFFCRADMSVLAVLLAARQDSMYQPAEGMSRCLAN